MNHGEVTPVKGEPRPKSAWDCIAYLAGSLMR